MNALSKISLLTEIVAQPAVLDSIGSAWRLYLRLVLIDGGRLLGTYDEIAERLGVNGRTIRNWASQLEEKNITKTTSMGKRVEISLIEPHKSISLAPDSIIKESSNSAPQDAKVMGLLQMYEGAKKAKSNIEMKVVFHASD